MRGHRGGILPVVHLSNSFDASRLKVFLGILLACVLFVGFRAYGGSTIKKIEQYAPGSPVVVITPTYRRADQAAALAYLSSVLRASTNQVFWVLVDDGRNGAEKAILDDLDKSGVPYWFLTPTLRDDCPGFQFGTCYNNQGHRGVAQRNLALRFLREKLYLYCDREHVNATLSSESSEYGHVDRYLGEVGTADAFGGGCAVEKIPKLLRTEPVVYFADDDNLYDVDLFRELTKVKRFGIVSVGFPWKAPRYVSAPVVGSSGQITAFDTFYCFDRAYPIDMANIAFSAKFLHEARSISLIRKYRTAEWLQPYMNTSSVAALVRKTRGKAHTPEHGAFIANAVGYKFPDNDMGAPPVRFYLHTKKYHLETDILEQLIASSQELEVLGEKGSRILAWHVAKPKAQEKDFEANKVGRYLRIIKKPFSNCKIR